MKPTRIALAAIFTLLISAASVAETVVVKLASLAPKGSAWDLSIRETDEKWRTASGGTVRMRIFSGTLGDESDLMRRMRIGQIDAASVTMAALSTIDSTLMAMNIPLAFASDDELDYVWRRMMPRWEARLHDKGYVVLNWGSAGWVHFFTKAPVERIDDLRALKLFIWTTGEVTTYEKLWKRMGFQPVPLSSVDILPSLQTGMISAFQSPPIMALGNQWFPFTGWMSDLKWGPVLGATVVRAEIWNRIPPATRATLERIARDKGVEMIEVVRRMERDAVAAMVKRGLEVVHVPPDAFDEWQRETVSIYPELRGAMIPAAAFDEVLRIRDEYRDGEKPPPAAAP
jgi:TRAP-type C4-dicarboxylate transport system substrate-binding protein